MLLMLFAATSLAGKNAEEASLKEETIMGQKSLTTTLRAARAAGHRNLDGKRTFRP